VLDSQRTFVQARRDRAASQGRLKVRFVTINKAIGNVPPAAAVPGASS
jgi:outer membrane protein TolC